MNIKSTGKKWSKSEVSDWFREKNIHQNIINILKDSDGEILYQSYQMYLKVLTKRRVFCLLKPT